MIDRCHERVLMFARDGHPVKSDRNRNEMLKRSSSMTVKLQ